MQNWMGAQKTVDAVSLLRDAHDIIAELPPDDAVAAVRQITDALSAINGADALTLEERYDDICLLDAATVERTRLLLREYLNTSRHTKQRESDLWNGAYGCWRELATAYALCVQRYADDTAAAAGFQKLAQISAARAMRALRRQLQWLRIRYVPPVPAIWEGLASLYVYIESEDIEAEMLIYPGESTSIKREFLKTLALGVLTSDNLMPPQQDLATYIVNRYANAFVLSQTPDAGCTHCFDLQHPHAPATIGHDVQPGADVRYFGAGAAIASLEEALRIIEQKQEVPADLGFTKPIELAYLTPVLTQIHLDWAGKTPERRHARETTNARVSVVPGFHEIVDFLDQSVADPFDFTIRGTAESWIARDISPDGFGVVMPAVSGDWVTVGSVLGIEIEAAGEWSVGLVRRVRRIEDGQQHIGVQVLCRYAQAVRVMRESPLSGNVRITQRMPIDRGLLLTADAAHQKEIDVLVSDAALYGAGNVHVLTDDSALLVKLREVLEVTADCTRISFTVLSAES